MQELDLGWYALRSVLALGVVVALMLFLAAVAKRFVPGLPMARSGDTRKLRVLESVVLDRRSRVHLVAIGQRRFLVGSGDGDIARLGEWTEDSDGTPAGEGNDVSDVLSIPEPLGPESVS